ncbi:MULTISPECIES: SGNH/GDSL hydrolase family protein [unclassified Meiothermus]|uniref:SGNH/GDSL hydrolase family protein n=1 Tax=unclassified Meiothermus TaxID=370471 RepID=UPI000D7BA9CE|nr:MULTISPECIES: SGNH/GDSL hydrolase family protein [unclassified Meiothermus]PZA08473.1 SGNH/GDSL hydrolase family protein [Meiothermus sp. Pnk-1]RYM37089.1 SGNH/GDSL hydrolase family protein [Meiothermus sp. PNK-Is4]
MIRHFVALGDSFTEGVGDPVEGIALRSAHDWLAEGMRAASPGLRYTNLASRGLRAGEIRAQQLQRGLSLGPDFVSIVAGANDCLKEPFDVDSLRAELNLMFGAFQSIGAQLFTATLPNFTLRLELPDGVRERVRRNLEAANHILHDLAGRYDAIFFDFWESELDKNPALWSEDGVHPNARGYLEIARQVAVVLERPGIALWVPVAQEEGR